MVLSFKVLSLKLELSTFRKEPLFVVFHKDIHEADRTVLHLVDEAFDLGEDIVVENLKDDSVKSFI